MTVMTVKYIGRQQLRERGVLTLYFACKFSSSVFGTQYFVFLLFPLLNVFKNIFLCNQYPDCFDFKICMQGRPTFRGNNCLT